MISALTWSSSSATVGTITTYTEDFLPNTSAISMNMRLSQVVTRGCFGYYEDPADIVTSVSGGGTDKNRRWGDDDPARAVQIPFGATTRRTSLSYNTGTFSFVSAFSALKARDRRNIIVSSLGGDAPRMLSNISSEFANWYYPSPTHAVIDTAVFAVTSDVAVSGDALVNPYPRVIHGTTTDSTGRGFGIDTLRFWGIAVATSGALWTRMTTPCKRYVAPSGGLVNNKHTLYGLPPEVYFSYGVVITAASDPGGVGYTATLTQSNALGVVVDTSTVSTGSLAHSTFVSGPDTYHLYLANNISIGGGTLVPQAHTFNYSVVTGYSGPSVDSSAITIWHKTPCWNDGMAISGDETSTDYIPGYVMEVT